MACECTQKVNAALEEDNQPCRLSLGLYLKDGVFVQGDRVMIVMDYQPRTKTGDKRNFLATYCPFCGTRYEEKPDDGH